MTDERRTSSTYPQQKYRKYTSSDGGAREKTSPAEVPPATPAAVPLAAPAAAHSPRRRHSGTGGRIVAAGVGIAAMLGLVANMEVANGQSQSAAPAPAPSSATQGATRDARQGNGAAPGRLAAAKVKRPIVLTPHAVVNTVGAPSSGGSGGGGGYAYSAPAPAAAPVASSGGS